MYTHNKTTMANGKKGAVEKEEVDVEADARINELKLAGHVASIEERLSRQLGITVEELRKKTVTLKNSKLSVK